MFENTEKVLQAFSVYAKELPREKHIVGKRFTQRIERANSTLRSTLKLLVRRTEGVTIGLLTKEFQLVEATIYRALKAVSSSLPPD